MTTSLRGRLQLALGACLVAFSLLLWFAGNRMLEALARDLVAAQLADSAESLLAALDFDAAGVPALRQVAPEYAQPFSGHYFRIEANDHALQSRSLWDQNLELAAPATGRFELLRVTGPQAQPLLVRAATYVKQARAVTIVVAADLGPIDTYRRRLAASVLVFAVVAVLVLGIAQHFVLRVSLRPLARMREALQAIERGTAERLPEDAPAEVLPLVREVNRLLSTLSRRLARSRHALGDLAHALKTPLQLLHDDLAQLSAPPEAVGDARRQATQIGMLVERELRRARLAGAGANTARFVLTQDLDDLCATMRQLHRDRQIAIDVDRRGERVAFGDREDMQELLGNLLDNACKWARHQVRIDLDAACDLRIVVADDGPGIEEGASARAMARGVRLDESRQGHGLGLAIVGDIVAAYGGELSFGRDDALGGLAVQVTLPSDTAVAGAG
jgi:signal transduction histidine kinase